MRLTRLLHHLLISSLLVLAMLLPVGCITEEVAPDTRAGNFEALWRTLDEHYCFFNLKREAYGLDWGEVHTRYAARISEKMTSRQLFEVMDSLICELRDGHVNLYAAHNTARYGAWFDAYPANYADTLERRYLGRTQDYMSTGGLDYRRLDDNVGYVRCSSFESEAGEGNLHEIVRSLALCDGLIVDIRNNGGGRLTAAQRLASVFVNTETVGGYMAHKRGRGHDDFSAPQPIRITPLGGLRWQKNVCILTNRRTFSAANSFVMFMKGLPGVTVVGDVTGGGGGMPLSAELPNGWSVRFSACPMYDREMRLTEMGIAPDVKVDITAADYARGIDTIIETARRLLRARHGQ